MTRFECPHCGAKIKANQDIRGRTIVCPGCQGKTRVAGDPVADAVPAPAVAAPPPVPAVSARPEPKTFDVTGREVEFQHSAFVPAKRARKLKPIALLFAGAAGFGCVSVIGFVIWTQDREAKLVASKQDAVTPVLKRQPDPKLEPLPPATPINASKDQIKQAIRINTEITVDEVARKAVNADKVKIQSFDVQQVIDDRKIEWIWEVTASVAITRKAEPDHAPESMSLIWKSLVCYTPELKGYEIWRHVIFPGTASGKRSHREHSEWMPEFREKVNAMWFRAFKKVTDSLPPGSSESDQAERLADARMQIAKYFGITEIEFQEILESTD